MCRKTPGRAQIAASLRSRRVVAHRTNNLSCGTQLGGGLGSRTGAISLNKKGGGWHALITQEKNKIKKGTSQVREPMPHPLRFPKKKKKKKKKKKSHEGSFVRGPDQLDSA